MTASAPASLGASWHPALTRAVLGLGVTQIIAWGSIYYALGVLGPTITRELGWAPQWTYAGFSAALAIAGLVSPAAGHAIDRLGGRLVMSAGSLVSAAGLVLLAASQGWWSYLLAWSVLGIAKAMVLYEAAFATLTQVSIARARRAITYVALFGGLASTVSWPATQLLHDVIGWRQTILVYAGLALVVCLPIHLLALPRRAVMVVGEGEAAAGATTPAAAAQPGPALPPAFLAFAAAALSASFALSSFMWSGLSVHLLAMLGLLGFSATAAVGIGAMIGPSQVLGRLGDMVIGGRVHPLQLLRVSMSLLPLAFALLILGRGSSLVAMLFAVLYGIAIGMNTIARGTVPLALFGPRGYGARLGRIAAPSFIAEAIAPIAYASVIAGYGAWGGLLVAAFAATLAWVGVQVLGVVWAKQRG